jgi:hypothetical protein
MIEYFDDWQKMTIAFYAQTTSYNPTTGKIEEAYALRDTSDVHIFQSSAMHGYVTDRMIDETDYTIVTGDLIEPTDIVYFNHEWFSMPYPDNVLFQDEVYTVLIKRMEAPNNIEGELPDVSVLGDGSGVI